MLNIQRRRPTKFIHIFLELHWMISQHFTAILMVKPDGSNIEWILFLLMPLLQESIII